MPHVDIPQDLFQQIQQVLPASKSADQFITQAVREKLASDQRSEEFLRLSDITRQAMLESGLTEEKLLPVDLTPAEEAIAAHRRPTAEDIARFNAICDEIGSKVRGFKKMTRDELHERR